MGTTALGIIRRHRSVLPLAFLLLLLLALPAFAGINQWTTNGPYGGTSIGSIVFAPSNPEIVYAGTGYGSIYKSLDGGTSWARKTIPYPGDNSTNLSKHVFVDIDPQNPAIIYAGTTHGVLKSTDAGESWTGHPLPNQTDYLTPVKVDPGNPSTVYAANGPSFYKSTDGGATWTPSSTQFPESIVRFALDPTNPEIIYATTSGSSIMKSTNGGVDWEVVYSWPDRSFFPVAITVDPSDHATVYSGTANMFSQSGGFILKSTDSGATWQEHSLGTQETTVVSILVDGTDPNRLFAATLQGLFTSTDAGITWAPLNSGIADTWVYIIAQRPDNPDFLLVGTDGAGLFASTDHGTSWQQAGEFNDLSVNDIAVHSGASEVLYAGTNQGLFRSTDSGNTWSLPDAFAHANISQVATSPNWPDDMFLLVNGGTKWWSLHASWDGGQSWEMAHFGASRPPYIRINLVTFNTNALFLATSHGLYDSLWHNKFPRGDISALAFDPTNPLILYAGTITGGMFKLDGREDRWWETNIGLTGSSITKIAVAPTSPATIYAGTTAGLYRSRDGGSTWVKLNDYAIRSLTIDPTNPATIYISGTGVWRSLDSGNHWEAIGNGATPSGINALLVSPSNPNLLFAAAGNPSNSSRGVYQWTFTPKIAVTPTAGFGTKPCFTSKTLHVTISNTGTGSLKISTPYTVTGADRTHFSVVPGGDNPCGSVNPIIPVGGSCTVAVTFTPTTTGTKSALLQIASNATNQPVLGVQLTGTGTPPISLTTTIAGSGAINNLTQPPAFSCATPACTAYFDTPVSLILRATPDAFFEFSGWSGNGCSGTGDCSLSVSGATTLGATFTPLPLVQLAGSATKFLSLSSAYAAAAGSAILKARNVAFTENLALDRPVAVDLQGGFAAGFATTSGETSLHGTISVQKGSLTARNLTIR